jgi:multicomponent Na+:H+ antiporter subunit A
LLALLLLHLALGLGVIAFGARLGRRGLLIAVIAPAAALAWLITQLGGVVDGEVVTQQVSWAAALDLTIDLRLDAFSALMVLLVAGIGVLVFTYALRYFPARREGLGRLVGLLTIFAGAMLTLVLADNLLLLYLGWELTSVTSYLLIGNDHREPRARAAALQAILITGAGGLAMLGGFVLLGQAAGTYQLSAILADPPSGGVVTVALLLVLAGALTKSAQYPFHSWLPGAMVAPTPVSAYLHSATMVKAGIYLVARFAPAFATQEGWRPVVLAVGLATMVFGGLRALRQHDLKLLLAFGTVSQLGFMLVLLGSGIPEATAAGCALLLAHGAFKAALFMSVGVIDHQQGTRDIRLIGRLGPGWGPLKVVVVVSAASMAAVPLTFGFIAKEAAYEAFLHGDMARSGLVLAGIVAGSVLTVAYSARFAWGVLADPAPELAAAGEPMPTLPDDHHPHGPPALSFVAPALLLSGLTLAAGVLPGLVSPLVTSATEALVPGSDPHSLAFWHGLVPALGLSLLTLALGIGLFVLRRPVSRLLAVGSRIPSGSDAYLGALRGLNVVADRVAGVVQSGSLPIYLGVILTTVAVLPGFVLLAAGEWPGLPSMLGPLAQVPVAAVLVTAALGAALVRRRIAAAVFLGVVGYAMAALFVISGAPDLALTTVAIETLATVLFVLVLRRLPDRFEHRAPPFGRALRAVVAAVVAATVFAFAIIASASRTADPISTELVARSLSDGHGRNVVNVILVDFRGLDTLGEITVLVVAAVGAVALARAGRSARARPGAGADAGGAG